MLGIRHRLLRRADSVHVHEVRARPSRIHEERLPLLSTNDGYDSIHWNAPYEISSEEQEIEFVHRFHTDLRHSHFNRVELFSGESHHITESQ